jgi:hypothetical protein
MSVGQEGAPLSRTEMQVRRLESSVRHLQALYAIAVAVALGFGFEHTVDARSKATAIALLVALVMTLIPFYHGTLRYLDDAYVFSDTNRKEAVLLEFVVRFLESCLFFGLAAAIGNPVVFGWFFVALLVTNIVWTRLTQLFCVKRAAPSPSFDWRAVNFVTVTAAIVFLSVLGTGSHAGGGSHPFVVGGILMLALARTAADYHTSWRFYAAVDDDDLHRVEHANNVDAILENSRQPA